MTEVPEADGGVKRVARAPAMSHIAGMKPSLLIFAAFASVASGAVRELTKGCRLCLEEMAARRGRGRVSSERLSPLPERRGSSSGHKPFRLRMKLRRTKKSETSEALAKEVGLRLQKVRSGVVVEGQGPLGIASRLRLARHFCGHSDTLFNFRTAPRPFSIYLTPSADLCGISFILSFLLSVGKESSGTPLAISNRTAN